jgi:hypothetical protein
MKIERLWPIFLAAAALVVLSHPSAARAQGRLGARLQRLYGSAESSQPNIVVSAPAPPEADGLGPWLKRLHESVPQTAASFGDLNAGDLGEAASAVEQWILLWGRVAAGQPPQEQISILSRLLDAASSIDRQLDNVLGMRAGCVSLPANEARHENLRNYLRCASKLIDLSGRLRYDIYDIIDDTAGRFYDRPDLRERLIDMLAARHSSVGAEVMAVELIDAKANAQPAPVVAPAPTTPQPRMSPRRMAMMSRAAASVQPPTETSGPAPLSLAQKLKLLRYVATCGTLDSIADLADVVRDETTPPTLILAAAEAIQSLGLPQDPRPGQDAAAPKPAITAAALRDRIMAIDPSAWRPEERPRVAAVMTALSTRIERGLEGDSYRIGQFDVQPGDWLLMRNPSPYNLFTDLSPGLFTHVGVVALETSNDGKRRMVVVDLPERGTAMPATNVEAFLDRTLNYVFVRDPDPVVARKMGEAAAQTIGNPTEFDLNFRTDRVAELKGKPLHGAKIHTYCAGLLLLCAQETGLPRELFFPITETTAAGHTKDNIAKLGLSLGDGFVSPTGALFSPRLKIVGRNEPSYDADREVEETIYDYFATSIAEKDLQPSADLFQALRLKVAEASKDNPLLAKALAASAGVSEQIDLIAAAKAAAVVETLDSIALGASGEFAAAERAIMDFSNMTPEQLSKMTPEERQATAKYRNRHANLAARWDTRQISPRTLRSELIKFYTDQGRQKLDERFVAGQPQPQVAGSSPKSESRVAQ